ncbi:MAG: hypothetical protein KGY48_03555 [Wenzhouxiangellaceae bacterium]|nr:hypothetical protein [Wenzhouxiangellaceae bacterium]MBS3746700.1 hypothetical protein [Wenzhouxiangellaceae bacterium]
MKFLAALLFACWSLPAMAQMETPDGDATPRYKVDSAVWCSGELRGEPELLLSPGVPGTFEIDGSESSWRLSVEVETPGRAEGAEPDSLWFKVGIEQMVDGQWEFLTDTMLGTPLGKPGIVTVVGDDGAESGPESAPLYVELTAQRVDPNG